MTTTPVLPSLPEPFDHILTLENSGATDDVPVFTAEQMDNYARRAIESLSRAPAEPAETEAWLIRMSDGTRFIHSHNAIADYRSLDPAAKVVELVPRGSGAHPTESAGPAPAEIEADAARYRWLRDISEPGICAFYLSVGKAFDGGKFARKTVDEAIDAQIAAIKLGESHEG